MKCPSSTVIPVKEILINGKPHAGLVTHKCKLEEHDVKKPCECECGARFLRNYK